MVFITELLSAFNALNRTALLVVWVVTDIVLLVILIQRCSVLGGFSLYSIKNRVIQFINGSTLLDIVACLAIIITVTGILLLDIFTVPYNWDSMTYHLPRIMIWAQNQNVNHFGTYDVRQLASPYLSEYINLHQYILLQSDRFFNCIQGVSFCFCAWGIYCISDELGLTKKWRLLSVILFVSTPIVFAEAITTQVDLLTTSWLIAFAYFWLLIYSEKRILCINSNCLTIIVVMAICIGFSYISKPSACIAMVLFLLVLLIWRIIQKDKVCVLLFYAFLAGSVVMIVICPGLIRNLFTFNSLSPQTVGGKQLIGTLDVRYVFLSLIKNLCYTLPSKYIINSDAFFYRVPIKTASLLGIDINHEFISENGQPYKTANPNDFGHDTAINPLIVWLFIICVVINIIVFIHKKKLDAFSLCAALSFIVFLSVVRWEPFETRYEVSYLALLCPLISNSLSLFTNNKKHIETTILCVLLCLSLFNIYNLFVFHTNMLKRSYVRPIGYFTYNYGLYDSWKNATSIINSNGYRNIGLHSNSSCFTYPIWTMCSDLNHVELISYDENETGKYTDYSFIPDAILWFGDTADLREQISWNGAGYTLQYLDDNCCLYALSNN